MAVSLDPCVAVEEGEEDGVGVFLHLCVVVVVEEEEGEEEVEVVVARPDPCEAAAEEEGMLARLVCDPTQRGKALLPLHPAS